MALSLIEALGAFEDLALGVQSRVGTVPELKARGRLLIYDGDAM